jgi:hypothetical protein
MYACDFFQSIPYSVYLPEDDQFGRNMSSSHQISDKKRFDVTNGLILCS